jgi:hypothetical protein
MPPVSVNVRSINGGPKNHCVTNTQNSVARAHRMSALALAPREGVRQSGDVEDKGGSGPEPPNLYEEEVEDVVLLGEVRFRSAGRGDEGEEGAEEDGCRVKC